VRSSGRGPPAGRSLVHVLPCGLGTDAEPGAEAGECLAFAQLGQYQQRLLAGIQLPSARPDPRAVAADHLGHEGQVLRDNGSAAR
jgi:hypothetical protein